MRNILNYTLLKNFVLFFFLIIAFSACSSLTRTQTKAVSQYFQTINSYPLYASQLNTALAHIKLNREQLYPNSFQGDSIMIETLVQSLKEFKNELIINGELSKALNEYNAYTKEYFLMIPNGFNVVKLLEGTTVTIAGFFGLNRVVSSAFSNVKSVKLSARKAKKIKEHIIKGNSIVENTSNQVQKYLNSIVKQRLSEENILLKENYICFLRDLDKSQDSYDYYAKYNIIFIEHYKLILNTEILAENLMEVTKEMVIVQAKLNKVVETRQKLESNVDEIHELYKMMAELNRTLAQFETYK